MGQFRTQLALAMTVVVVGAVGLVGGLLVSSSTRMLRDQTAATGRAYAQMLVTVLSQFDARREAMPPMPPPGENGPDWMAGDVMRRLAGHTIDTWSPTPPRPQAPPGTGAQAPPGPQPPSTPGAPPERPPEGRAEEDLAELVDVLGALQIAIILDDGTIVEAKHETSNPLRLDANAISALWKRFERSGDGGILEEPSRRSVSIVAAIEQDIEGPLAGVMIQLPTGTAIGMIRRNAAALIFTVLLIAIAAALATILLSRSITNPLTRLVSAADRFGQGMLSDQAPIGGPRETRTLGLVFNEMALSLRDHMAELQDETRRREQLETELRVAADLQQSLLPDSGVRWFGPYAVAGWNQQAREVGGDFYGYWELSPTRSAVVVGDATGKGMTAALLAAETLSAIQTLADAHTDPATVLGRANQALCRQFKRDGYFATVAMVVLDSECGTASFTLGGHNPPLLMCSRGGEPEWIRSAMGLPLGIRDEVEFETITVALEPGASILLYTDGVTEAFDMDGTLYGDARLAAVFAQHGLNDAVHVLDRHMEDLSAHRAGRAPSDDATLVLIQCTAVECASEAELAAQAAIE